MNNSPKVKAAFDKVIEYYNGLSDEKLAALCEKHKDDHEFDALASDMCIQFQRWEIEELRANLKAIENGGE